LARRLPGTLDALDDVSAFILDVARRAGLDRRRSYRLRLAADEIATNVVTHGYADGRSGELWMTADISAMELTVSLEDAGPAFNPMRHRWRPRINAPLQGRKEGGLGLYLVRRSVDRFCYERRCGRNRNTLVMQLGDRLSPHGEAGSK